MNHKPLYIFDLDGTLANCEHRQHHLSTKPADWRAFFAACAADTPIQPVIDTLHRLFDGGAEIRIFSGRSDEVRPDTMRWLKEHVHVPVEVTMRRMGDYTADDILKRAWLHALPAADRERLVAVFDDRQKVVDMWRAEGVPCFQVAPGEF